MRTLIINRQERARSLDTLYNGLSGLLGDVTHAKLTKVQIERLAQTLDELDADSYDRVLLDIPVRRAAPALERIARIPGLVYYEEDAYQEFMEVSKFHGHFLEFFRSLGGAPVIVTGYRVRDYLLENGINVHCVPKAYDDAVLRDLGLARDIPVGFVGRINNRVYSARRTLLESLQANIGLQILRTETADEYLHLLNRIRVFFSADIGLNEYMAKNFEAMACGCVLLAKRQHSEEAALGLVDMHNVVLYDTEEEALQRYRQLEADPDLAVRIATAGRELAVSRHRLSLRCAEFAAVLSAEYPPRMLPAAGNWWARLRAWIRKCTC